MGFAILLSDALLHGLQSVLFLSQYFPELLNTIPVYYFVYFYLLTHHQQILLCFQSPLLFLYLVQLLLLLLLLPLLLYSFEFLLLLTQNLLPQQILLLLVDLLNELPGLLGQIDLVIERLGVDSVFERHEMFMGHLWLLVVVLFLL